LALGEHVLEAFALALGLPVDYFRRMTNKPMVTMRLIHYPPQSTVVDEEQLGCGAHTDYECFTLLSQSNHTALQILNKQGRWIDAVPKENTFVVNVGDLMQRWTNDEFTSTVHRVVNLTGQQRYSIPVFFGPNYFTEIRSLTVGSTSNYAPIVAGHYLTERFDQTYRYREMNSPSVEH
jgi:isopenicillin N synthase-like dioxygenase